VGEDVNFEAVMKRAAAYRIVPDQLMRVIPKYVGREGREMLARTQAMLHDGMVAIPPHTPFKPLLRQMRSAIELNGNLDKTRNSLASLDAFRLELCYYHYDSRYERRKEQVPIES
jgi:hypothetical protein